MITDLATCERELRRIDYLMDRRAVFPNQVFRVPVCDFWILEFDEFWTGRLFRDLKALSCAIGDEGFTLAVLKPDPTDYFFHHFKKCPILRFSLEESDRDYFGRINADPGSSPADAVAVNSDVVLAYAESLRWAVYGSRHWEIAAMAAMDEGVADAVRATPLAEIAVTTALAVHTLVPMIYERGVPEELSSGLLANYQAGTG
ncbi:MAG TPA: hypothetical protein VJ276_04560 [Thermoanaerobaculia bacterium]|nr:hypothetical protein [Thermoanaerobaculia bacterium]